MGASEEAQIERDAKYKQLRLTSGEGSSSAYCLSSYGAFIALNRLSPKGIREVFSNTPSHELEKLAESLDDHIKDMDPIDNEGQIKDLAFKREVLLFMAEHDEEYDTVTCNSSGRFE